MPDKTVLLSVKRRKGPDEPDYWEEFEVPMRPAMNVIAALQAVQRHPVNRAGEIVDPVTWEANCLEEVCGACTMNINGRARQACSALVSQLDQPIRLEPMTKFPVVRDLAVDRQSMFDNLKKTRAWIDIDGTYDIGPGPRMSDEEAQEGYILSRCMSCGCCLEVCPQVNEKSDFMGPAVMSQAVLFNSHPSGKLQRRERLSAIMGPGGIQECGKSQNCVQVCPKEIPLTESLARLARESTVFAITDLLRR
ncbi:MAG: succinate dehydrogenase iron-sulfur subunit [Planctomycetota bacterium]|jgi:succinate dehydrogenase / fumarate reductase iron-sulfur subunit